jgi:hypothetical protein
VVGPEAIVTVVESLAELGAVLPAGSATDPEASRAITVPSCGHDVETVNVVPDEASGVNVQLPAVP